MMEQRAHREFKESKVQPVHRVFKVTMAQPARKAYRAYKVLKGPLEHKGSKVYRVCKV
jgi:hypothetical protein